MAAASGSVDSLAQALESIGKADDGEYAPWQLAALAGLVDALDRQRVPLADFRRRADNRVARAMTQLGGVFAFARGVAADTEAPDSDRRLIAKVPGTGNWDTYRTLQLGQVELAAGQQQLTVRPDGPPRGAVLDLKAVRLRPVK